MRRAARVDANQEGVVRYLRAHGITVTDTHRLPGIAVVGAKDEPRRWIPDPRRSCHASLTSDREAG